MHFLHIAMEDYMGCRCCILSHLLTPGFVLGQQAIEKVVKSILFTLNEDQYDKKLNHKINPLIRDVNTIADTDLIPHIPLIDKLDELYNSLRYPPKINENRPSTFGLSSPELDDFDEYFFNLMEIHPMPDELKYNTFLFHILFNTSKYVGQMKDAAVRKNKALEKRRAKLNARFLEVEEYILKG